jgi:hypothetical protein
LREVSFLALDKTFSATVSQWPFLQDFTSLMERTRKVH